MESHQETGGVELEDEPVAAQAELLERDAELATLEELINGAFGRLLAFEGPPGIGKTSLLRDARIRAQAVGVQVLGARGSELESAFSFGVVRQLFEPLLAQLSEPERAELLAGAAELATPVFEPARLASEPALDASLASELGTNFFENRFAGGDDSFDLLQIRAARTLVPSREVPERLVAPDQLRAKDAVRTRSFELNGTSINGKEMDMGRIDEAVVVDTTEIWEVHNNSGTPHSFHPHDVQFRVLEYAGAPPPPHLGGPKDTVYVPPGDTVRIVVHFSDYTDSRVPYMFHCHVLQHEDRGMMGQFVVVEPGQRAGAYTHEHEGDGS
jgi:hypothetical protein